MDAPASVPEVWARDGRRTEYAPGALDVLRLLEPGAGVALVRADGRRERWVATDCAVSSDPEARDAVEVDDTAGTLRLVVCGGPYDPVAGGYRRSVVIRCAPDRFDARAATA